MTGTSIKRQKRMERNQGKAKNDPVIRQFLGFNGEGLGKIRTLFPTRGWKISTMERKESDTLGKHITEETVNKLERGIPIYV